MQTVTREEFAAAYAGRSGTTVEWLTAHGRVAAPCDCGEPDCEGWQMAYVFLLEEAKRNRSALPKELATLAWLEEQWGKA